MKAGHAFIAVFTYPNELTMPNDANDVHQQPSTTNHAVTPPSGKLGVAGCAGVLSHVDAGPFSTIPLSVRFKQRSLPTLSDVDKEDISIME